MSLNARNEKSLEASAGPPLCITVFHGTVTVAEIAGPRASTKRQQCCRQTVSLHYNTLARYKEQDRPGADCEVSLFAIS